MYLTTIEPKLEIRVYVEEKEDMSRVTKAIFSNSWMQSFRMESVKNYFADYLVLVSI